MFHRTLRRQMSVAFAIGVATTVVLNLGHALGAQLSSDPHLALEQSVPEADAAVGHRLEEVRLFFSQPPQLAGTSIRVVDARDRLMEATAAEADSDDPSVVFIRLEGVLAAGTYTVHWRALAQDNHPVNGDFGFAVVTE
ncbi:MAG: copper resistance protein CopC [Gammaproteobacteria bacterium]|nr:copper resistance protein CopC [Gammaproteobacteria bacterium]MDE0246511.1 copper resistance protein CopC [Gammaproteobacteria bacterium]